MLPRRSKDSDTDPSTPDAIGLPVADTDPGLGPPPPPLPPPPPRSSPRAQARAQPLTPPSSLPLPAPRTPLPPSPVRNDSVEQLLEGIPELQPQPPRSTPQTAGQASAAYHVEHAVLPAHTSPDDIPKVLVERPPQRPTLRIDRDQLKAVLGSIPSSNLETEEPQGLPMSLKIAIAVVAGLAVVLGIFLYVRPTDEPTATSAPAAETTVATKPPPPPPIPTASTISAPPTSVPPLVAASALPIASPPAPPPPVLETPTAAGAPPPAGPAARPRPKPSANPGGGDLGEFKTTFH